MNKRQYIFLILLYCTTPCFSQNKLTGKVMDKLSNYALEAVIIENKTLNIQTVSRDSGLFALRARPGDTIVIKAFTYKDDTLIVDRLSFFNIYLDRQSIALDEVQVRPVAPVHGNWLDPGYHGQSMVYQPNGGLIFRIWYWKKDEKRKLKRLQQEKDWHTELEIEKVFSKDSVSKYIPLRGYALDVFIWLYKPTVKAYNAPNFNLLLYINDCYKKFNEIPDEQKKIPALVN